MWTIREWLTNALKKLGMNEAKDKLSTRSLGEPAGAVL